MVIIIVIIKEYDIIIYILIKAQTNSDFWYSNIW